MPCAQVWWQWADRCAVCGGRARGSFGAVSSVRAPREVHDQLQRSLLGPQAALRHSQRPEDHQPRPAPLGTSRTLEDIDEVCHLKPCCATNEALR